MEILSPAWFLILLCCTDLFGIRQCVAVPVPNVLNYYQRTPANNWNYKYRTSRNPAIYFDKLTFPKKEREFLGERSGNIKRFDSGKIFFPDDAEAPEKEVKSYQFTDSEVTRPVWQTLNHRPTVKSREKWRPPSDETKISFSVDDTTEPIEDGRTQLSSLEANFAEQSSLEPSPPERITNVGQKSQEEIVAAAVQQFYEWLKRSKSKHKSDAGLISRMKSPKCPPTMATSEAPRKHKPDYVSDQSLVSGLPNQSCPDGQERLANGECKVKVEV